MTQSFNAADANKPTQDPGAGDADDAFNVLLTLLIHALMPMFLCGGVGNLQHARIAAVETVNAFRVRNALDLFSIVQIVGFGLGALGSLGLSMADGLELPIVLRLRGNACSLNRAAEQSRRALERERRAEAEVPTVRNSEMAAYAAAYEAQAVEAMRQTQTRAAEAHTRMTDSTAAEQPVVGEAVAAAAVKAAASAMPVPCGGQAATIGVTPASAVDGVRPTVSLPVTDRIATATSLVPEESSPVAPMPEGAMPLGAVPVGTVPTGPVPRDAEKRYRAMFAAAMNEVAAEATMEIANLPPSQRREASIRAQAMSSTAHALLAGVPLPPAPFSLRNSTKAEGAAPSANAGKNTSQP